MLFSRNTTFTFTTTVISDLLISGYTPPGPFLNFVYTGQASARPARPDDVPSGQRAGEGEFVVTTTEIAPEIYRLAVFVPEINLEFSHFLVRDEEPLLFHAGLRSLFPLLRDEMSRLIDPSKLRHIGFSHFESDECGALNQWLEQAPSAQPVCGLVGAMVSVNDFSIRPARVLTRDDLLETGRYRFRFLPAPHVPHGWDAGVLFEVSEKALFCSDLFP